MAKKIIHDEVEPQKAPISQITTEFGRTDLTELRDKINELVRAANQ